MDNNPYIATFAAFLATAFLVNKWLHYTDPNLSAIPAIGPTGRLSSFPSAFRFLLHGNVMIQEGIQKYQSAAFRVPTMSGWMVVLRKKSLVNDIRQAREDELSFHDAVDKEMHTQYTFGKDVSHNHYHVDVIRTSLTRNLAGKFPEARDEIIAAFNDNIPKTEGILGIYSSSGYRHTSGIDTLFTREEVLNIERSGRDPDYRDLNIEFATQVFAVGQFLSSIPLIFRPIIGPLLSPMPRAIKRARKHLVPLIAQRMKDDAELGIHREDRPNDLLSWLSDAAPEEEKNVTAYIKRVLLVNLAAIHTTSNTFTQALLQLAGRPEYIQPIREEVESVIEEEGWSKAAMGKLRKLDSFLRECIRWEGFSALSLGRIVRKPGGFYFSDGTHVPQGTFVAFSAWDTHHSEENYVKPLEFNGFRFSDMRELEGESTRHQVVDTSPEYVVFGHGRHACPGRFFAANEIKAMFAHILLNYDIKLEDEIPPTKWFKQYIVLDKGEGVMFRRRQM
ncbi:hypothetical protein ONZ45_g9315 [Pleurotus djamor]|nr:hypothetical protein ONZ45_g9315 [Pleurotus djamor]